MKKTVTINLFGTAYTIDEDAHLLLEQYFSNMKSYFSRQAGGDEIADDIEHRVAELLWEIRERGNGWDAISIEQVKEIIQKVGNPEQMTDQSEDAQPEEPAPFDPGNEENMPDDGSANQLGRNVHEQHNHTYGQQSDDKQSASSKGLGDWLRTRRFFRDPEDKRIGGVISGACHYFGAKDPLLWRLGYALLCALAIFGDWPFFLDSLASIIRCSVFLYLLIWMVAPEATTAEDRLRMKGLPVNPDSINDELLNAHGVYGQAGNNQAASQNAHGCLGSFTDIIALCVKALLIIIGVFLALGVIFPIVALIALICNAPMLGQFLGFGPDMLQSAGDNRGMLILMVVALITVVALPIYALCRWLIKSKKTLSAGVTALLIVLWLVALAFIAFSGINFAGQTFGNANNWNWHWTYTVNSGDVMTVTRHDNTSVFDAIDIEGVGTITYRQGNDYAVTLKGEKEAVELTEVYVEEGVLKVRNAEDGDNDRHGGLDVEITSPNIRKATMQGVGQLRLADSVSVSNPVVLKMEGVGSLVADYLSAPAIHASNNGVGSSTLNVKCDSLWVDCQGVGAIKISGETHYYQRNNNDLLGAIKDSGLNITE